VARDSGGGAVVSIPWMNVKKAIAGVMPTSTLSGRERVQHFGVPTTGKGTQYAFQGAQESNEFERMIRLEVPMDTRKNP